MEEYILLLMAPVFLACIVWEARYWQRRGVAKYSLVDTVSNAVLALTHQGADLLAWTLVLPLYYLLYQVRLFDVEFSVTAALLLLIAQDFCYYWFHRCSHRIRWMWAAHVVHHSSTRLNLSTAFRQSLMYPVAGMWLFWLPLAWLGFEPHYVMLCVGLSLGYQFFVHTEAVRHLGVLEYVFNTPSHHRVHHACNDLYIDRNYAGVFIIWDRLFGTFQPELAEEPCTYGIRRQVHGHNPLMLVFHEWWDMFRDAARPGPWRERLKHFWKPPEWQREAE